MREDSENLVALLWLAFLAVDHGKRILLLRKVLEIDPDNKRAQAGLKWAEDEIKKEKKVGDDEKKATESKPSLPDLGSLQRRFQTTDLKRNARKGTIAQRARKRIGKF